MSKLSSFYDAMPDGLTIDECAEGVDIKFKHDGKNYMVNTSAGYIFRTRPMHYYYTILGLRVKDTNPV